MSFALGGTPSASRLFLSLCSFASRFFCLCFPLLISVKAHLSRAFSIDWLIRKVVELHKGSPHALFNSKDAPVQQLGNVSTVTNTAAALRENASLREFP